MDRRLFAHIQARASATEERRGGAERRRQLLAGLSGRVVEVGAGSGVSFAYYPAAVRELVAVEPEQILRERGLEAAERAPVPVEVVDGVAERLPLPDASVDAVVLAGVLCSVPDPSRALDEAARVLRANGELRFYEHVVARNRRLARMQRLFDATFWPRLFGGCHTSRDTEATLVASGFTLDTRERWSFRPTHLATPVAPRIVGRAPGSGSARHLALGRRAVRELAQEGAMPQTRAGWVGGAEVLVADRDELRRRAEARGARDQQPACMSGGVPFGRTPKLDLLKGGWKPTVAPRGRSGAPLDERARRDDSG